MCFSTVWQLYLRGTGSSCVWHKERWEWSRWRSPRFPWRPSWWCWGDKPEHVLPTITRHPPHCRFTPPPLTWGWQRWQSPVWGRGPDLGRDRGRQTQLLMKHKVTHQQDYHHHHHHSTCEEGKPCQDRQSLPLRLRVVWRHGEPHHHRQRAERRQQPALRRTEDEDVMILKHSSRLKIDDRKKKSDSNHRAGLWPAVPPSAASHVNDLSFWFYN